jgi:hypothetical protein
MHTVLARQSLRLALLSITVSAWLGCAPSAVPADVTRTDATSAPTEGGCGTCGREVRCPSGLALACAGGLLCRDMAVFRRIAAPYNACDEAQLESLRRDDACSRYVTRVGTCRAGCAPSPAPSRYAACDLSATDTARTQRYARLLCADPLPMPFTPCMDDADCHPVADIADLDLVCRGGRCSPVARPSPSAEFGQDCGLSMAPARDGVFPAPRCALCVVRTRGCFAQQCSQTCQLDEDCPAGWDCAVDARCEGVCVPRGSARDRSTIELACGASSDGGSPDASGDR